ncbi:snoRNP Gar1 nucleolar protein [Encephalitozoon intestinalis ATCC 50506]|uniref:H/ACA ribonucleoprotein complex subunit n=1 Tax=Encephalitozoon intestinalis (strain ATCC 50506) TaxID=876142 RepID=E0S5K7_ENCIT|nr:snoRNP Gar1 nucleolar protein [Encephalitozoon intestinalis ATCC 50506]ADM10992.1 snoRNP Gar1 nucleolar protein [Encephalitozoon intestinalis ATCC 50506]UTX44629.1 snoRNP Gar1 nucleolar protein [Encephalitozoon intestinalis]
MARDFKNRRTQRSTETMELGKVLYMCQGQLVIKLTAKDIPYPNSPVLNSSSKIIGKVDEILGRIDDVHATIKMENPCNSGNEGETVFCYADKLIPKKRFLPREEVEKKKEEMDRTKPKRSQGLEKNKPRTFRDRPSLHNKKPGSNWGGKQSGWNKSGRKGNFEKNARSKKPDSNKSKRGD